jgi:hypothetical protein
MRPDDRIRLRLGLEWKGLGRATRGFDNNFEARRGTSGE